MNNTEAAKAFTALCAEGEFERAGADFWADDVTSVEPMEGPMAVVKGRAAVEGKSKWWYDNHTVHGAKVEGPFLNGDQFILRFELDVTPKGGERRQMKETGLYTLKDGKIVEERFFF